MRALLPALLWPVGAYADTLADTHFSMNFCWERVYSVQHLAEHPDQTVTTIRLSREPMGFPKAPGQTLMTIDVTFRGAAGGRQGPEAEAIGYCRPDGESRFLCGMEGDAGSYRIEAQGGHEILLAPGGEGMLFETREAFHELREDEGDDRAFLLRRCG